MGFTQIKLFSCSVHCILLANVRVFFLAGLEVWPQSSVLVVHESAGKPQVSHHPFLFDPWLLCLAPRRAHLSALDARFTVS